MVFRLATRQWGTVSRAQLLSAGVAGSTISRWVRHGFLSRVHPGVYVVGHQPHSCESRLAAALLFAGRGAALSRGSATFWWRITPLEPAVIDIDVPTCRRRRDGIRFHRASRPPTPLFLRRLPVVPPAVALLGLAATAPLPRVRRALAEADRLGLLDADAIRNELGSGRPGSGRLRRALAIHLPQLASTLSVLEERFLELLDGTGIPMPEVNATVAGAMVDALFRDAGLVVELDGHEFHAGAAAAEEDRRRELRLRAYGYRVVRYTWRQINEGPGEVVADLRRELRA